MCFNKWPASSIDKDTSLFEELDIDDSSLNALIDEILLNFILTNLEIDTRKAFLIALTSDDYEKAIEIALNNIENFQEKLEKRMSEEMLNLHNEVVTEDDSK